MTGIKLSRRIGEKWSRVCGCGVEWMAANECEEKDE